MRLNVHVPRHAGWMMLGVLFSVAACTSDNTNNTPTNPTLDAAFVGYSNPATQQTTCGNCHINKQRSWAKTGHARAWADLQNSGHAAAYCNNCHTTNGSSNLASDSAGYLSVASDARPYYQDVQCESCHGPGTGHVSAPDDGQPLTTIQADTNSSIGCGTCHTGTHDPFVEQWRKSLHGSVNSHATAADCVGCHTGQGFLARLDPTANYLEKNSTTLQPITCATCHDPHGNDNPANLRLMPNAPTQELNLCMQCHMRRSVPDPTSSRGPHSPQGPMVLGEAGYIPPNFQYDAARAATSHGNSANPGMCVTCHMESFDVTEKATGAFQLHSTGHSFQAVPCVDANGLPTDSTTCPDSQRRFNACATGGCHSSGTIAMNLRAVLKGRMQTYANILWVDRNANGVLDPIPTDTGLLAIAKKNTPCDFSTSSTVATTGACAGLPAGNTVISVGEGVWFNVDMINRGDGSWGVHNPVYAEALMLGGIQALHVQYPYLPTPPAGVQAMLNTRMDAVGVRH